MDKKLKLQLGNRQLLLQHQFPQLKGMKILNRVGMD